MTGGRLMGVAATGGLVTGGLIMGGPPILPIPWLIFGGIGIIPVCFFFIAVSFSFLFCMANLSLMLLQNRAGRHSSFEE